MPWVWSLGSIPARSTQVGTPPFRWPRDHPCEQIQRGIHMSSWGLLYHQFWDQVEKNLLQNLLSSKDSPPRFSCLLLIGRIFLSAVTDWADIFYPRFLIGRIFIRVPMPAPSHHREICSKSTRDFCSDSIASRYFNFFGWIQKFSIVSIRNKRYHSTSKV